MGQLFTTEYACACGDDCAAFQKGVVPSCDNCTPAACRQHCPSYKGTPVCKDSVIGTLVANTLGVFFVFGFTEFLMMAYLVVACLVMTLALHLPALSVWVFTLGLGLLIASVSTFFASSPRLTEQEANLAFNIMLISQFLLPLVIGAVLWSSRGAHAAASSVGDA